MGSKNGSEEVDGVADEGKKRRMEEGRMRGKHKK